MQFVSFLDRPLGRGPGGLIGTFSPCRIFFSCPLPLHDFLGGSLAGRVDILLLQFLSSLAGIWSGCIDFFFMSRDKNNFVYSFPFKSNSFLACSESRIKVLISILWVAAQWPCMIWGRRAYFAMGSEVFFFFFWFPANKFNVSIGLQKW